MSGARVELLLPQARGLQSGGFIYDHQLVAQLRARRWEATVHELEAAFPRPGPAGLAGLERCLAGLPAGRMVILDGLVLGAAPDVVARHADRLCLLGLVHHPLARESGLEPGTRAALHESERRALRAVRHVLVTSAHTARELGGYGVVPARITVAPPGCERPAKLAAGSGSDSLHLLCVATLVPRKGHALLFEALATLSALPWQLDCVGSTALDPDTVRRLRRQVIDTGLAARVRLRGQLGAEALAQCYHRSDVFVLPSLYEGYGMAASEALAHGLPILATTGGALAETLPAEAALCVPPGNPGALREALQRMLTQPALRARLSAAAVVAATRQPTWAQTGGCVDALLRRLGREGSE